MRREVDRVGKMPESEIVKAEQSVVESFASNQPIQIWGCGTIFTAHLPTEISNQNAIVLPNQPQVRSRTSMLLPVVIKSHRRGPMSDYERKAVGKTMRDVVERRIAREAIKAFGITLQEQAIKFSQQFIESGESYSYMAQDLRKRNIRLGEVALKRLAKKFKDRRKDEPIILKGKAGRPPLKIDENEVERLCIEKGWSGPELAKHFRCSESKISTILRSRYIFRQGGRRPKPAEPL